jgi:hypothetical protein
VRPRPIILASTAAFGLVLTSLAFAAPVAPPTCGGRFLVEGASLVASDTAGVHEPVIVADHAISIGNACPLVRGTVRVTKRGTRVKAQWRGCSSLKGRVRLLATIAPGCSVMAGRLVARKSKLRVVFTARQSECGDGIVDQGAGEQCDSGLGCSVDQYCSAGCQCLPVNVGLSTTTTPTSTTEPSSTTSTTVCLPRYARCSVNADCCSAKCTHHSRCL